MKTEALKQATPPPLITFSNPLHISPARRSNKRIEPHLSSNQMRAPFSSKISQKRPCMNFFNKAPTAKRFKDTQTIKWISLRTNWTRVSGPSLNIDFLSSFEMREARPQGQWGQTERNQQ